MMRLSSPDYSNPTTWEWAWAAIFTLIGLGGFVVLSGITFPLILVVVGLIILGSTLMSRA